jgi:RNA polymerase sigma-B factor
VGVGFSAVPQMASPLSPSRRRQPAAALSRSALRARDALVLEHLPLAVAERFRAAVAIATAAARRLFPLVEREDLIQVAREALVRSAPRLRAGEPPAPYLRRCISGALQHHLRDRVRLVRVPRQVHEQGQCPLRHLSLDASPDGEPCLLDQLAAPEAEPALSEAVNGLALEQLVEQLPAAQATALRLTVLEGLSLRQAAERLEISCMSVSHREVRFAAQRAQKKAIAALRLQLQAGG